MGWSMSKVGGFSIHSIAIIFHSYAVSQQLLSISRLYPSTAELLTRRWRLLRIFGRFIYLALNGRWAVLQH